MYLPQLVHVKTYYFWILFINACNTAFTSAVLCGENIGRNVVANNGAKRCVKKPECGSGGPTIDTTSGSTASSVANVLINWSSNDFLGSTFVGDRHASNTDFGGSADKLKDCFVFLLVLGVPLAERNNLLRRSFETVAVVCAGVDTVVVAISFSRGGLPVYGGSEFGASGSVLTVPPPPSLPELSFFHSVALSVI